MRAMLARLFVESKRVIVYVFSLLVQSVLLVTLAKLGVDMTVLAVLAGGVTGTVSVALPVLINGISKTDIAEAQTPAAVATIVTSPGRDASSTTVLSGPV